MACTDAITSINNRNAFEKRLKFIRKKIKDSLLLILDLYNSKQVNDTFGHKIGDLVSKRTATVIKQV